MRFHRSYPFLVLLYGLLLVGSTSVRSMIFYSTADPDFNARPPAGYYAGSGWQWQGQYSHGTGTLVSPDQVLTAKHLSRQTEFKLNGRTYPIIDIQDDPESDLRLLTLDMSEHGRFTSWAPIYSGFSEKGAEIVVHGRGVGRGEEVVVGSRLRGWRYSQTRAGILRWGTNEVVGFAPYENHADYLLQAEFDPTIDGTECQLTDWDSGGGVFIRKDGLWKLAGVNYAVDANFGPVTGNAGTFKAALFDVRGLEPGGSGLMPDRGQVSSSFYATRVSRRLEWLIPRLHMAERAEPPGMNPNVRNALVVFGLAGAVIVWRRQPPARQLLD